MTRTISRSIAVASAVAIGAAALAVPVTAQETTPETSAAERIITDGSFHWALRDSLWTYVTGPVGNGSATLSDELTQDPKTFVVDFPVDTENSSIDADGNGTIDLDGSVHFLAHKAKDGHWELDVELSNFELEIEGTTVSVLGDYATKGKLPSQASPVDISGEDAVFATFTLDEAVDPDQDSYSVADREVTWGDGFGDAWLEMYGPNSQYEPAPAGFDLTFGDAEEEPSTPAQPSETPKPTESTTPAQPSETTKPSTPAQPSETTKPSTPAQPSETPKPTTPEQPSETPKPTETTKPSETPKPTESTKPSETNEPSENQNNDKGLNSSEREFSILGTIIAIILTIAGIAGAAGLIPGFTLPNLF